MEALVADQDQNPVDVVAERRVAAAGRGIDTLLEDIALMDQCARDDPIGPPLPLGPDIDEDRPAFDRRDHVVWLDPVQAFAGGGEEFVHVHACHGPHSDMGCTLGA